MVIIDNYLYNLPLCLSDLPALTEGGATSTLEPSMQSLGMFSALACVSYTLLGYCHI